MNNFTFSWKYFIIFVNKGGDVVFSRRLKLLRKERRLTQNELAEYLHTKNTTISNYENEVSSPDMDMLKEIASFFNVSTDYLLGKTNTRDENVSDIDVAFYNQHGIITEEQRKEIENFIAFIKSRDNKK